VSLFDVAMSTGVTILWGARALAAKESSTGISTGDQVALLGTSKMESPGSSKFQVAFKVHLQAVIKNHRQGLDFVLRRHPSML
jgi:hypothetical protein